MLWHHAAVKIQIRIGKSKRGHKSRLSRMDQQFRFSPADGQLVTVEEAAILIVKTESVAAGEGDIRIWLAEKKQVPVFQNKCLCDAALNGRNSGDEVGALGAGDKNSLVRHEITWAKNATDANPWAKIIACTTIGFGSDGQRLTGPTFSVVNLARFGVVR